MANIDGFLKLDGISGESIDKGHTNEIQVLGWHWGMTNSSSVAFGTGSATGKAQVGELIVTKRTDSSTAALITSVTLGKHIKTGVLTLRKASGKDGAAVPYLVINMVDMWVSGIEQGNLNENGEDYVEEMMKETVRFTFVGFKLEYTQQKDDGSPGGKFPVEYNQKTNTASMGS
jgi:type VI secretion system secreted protein Hcp